MTVRVTVTNCAKYTKCMGVILPHIANGLGVHLLYSKWSEGDQVQGGGGGLLWHTSYICMAIAFFVFCNLGKHACSQYKYH